MRLTQTSRRLESAGWKPTDQQLEQAAWFILEGLDKAVPRRYLLELMRVALVELERRLRP